jgi:hypothetical protein
MDVIQIPFAKHIGIERKDEGVNNIKLYQISKKQIFLVQ